MDEIFDFLSIKLDVNSSQDISHLTKILINEYCDSNHLNLPIRIKKKIKGDQFHIFLELRTHNNLAVFGECTHKDQKIAERIAEESLLFNLFPVTKDLSQIHQMIFTFKKMKSRKDQEIKIVK